LGEGEDICVAESASAGLRLAGGTSPAALTFLAVSHSPANLLISVIVLNYNGARWLQRCLESLRAQTIFDQIEVILADNVSSDGSERLGKQIVGSWPRGVFIRLQPLWPGQHARFLRWRLNRWDEVQRLRQFGVPKVTDTPPVSRT
jgi:hypothetical protein